MFGRIAALIMKPFQKQRGSNDIVVITSDGEHNRCYKEANALVNPYLKMTDASEKTASTRKAKADLRRGISIYRAVVAYAPKNWAAYWLMGKAHQALKEHEHACEAFENAFALQNENPDVAREYMFECLELGRITEAIGLAEHAVSLKPRDAGLLANHSLALTIAGRTAEALAKAEESLAIDPHDKVTSDLKCLIEEIQTGKRRQPRNLKDLEAG